eukprot:84001_1
MIVYIISTLYALSSCLYDAPNDNLNGLVNDLFNCNQCYHGLPNIYDHKENDMMLNSMHMNNNNNKQQNQNILNSMQKYMVMNGSKWQYIVREPFVMDDSNWWTVYTPNVLYDSIYDVSNRLKFSFNGTTEEHSETVQNQINYEYHLCTYCIWLIFSLLLLCIVNT